MTTNSSPSPAITPAAAATLAASTMFAADRYSNMLGFSADMTAPGRAVVSVTIRDDMLNGHDICHGGLIFTLADTALAHASNSHNQVSVAAGCSIEFLAPARRGDRLRAQAEELSRRGRNGIYDVRVLNQDDQLIALFRGKCRTLEGVIVAGIDIAQSGAG